MPASHRTETSWSDPDWLSVRLVAMRLSVSQRQVRKWITAGQFDEVRTFGPKLMRVSRASYHRFVESSGKDAST